MGTVMQQRHAYGSNQHRFHPDLWDLAKQFGFTPRLCRPYRAKAKGRTLHRLSALQLLSPFVEQLKQVGLILDVETANLEVLKWLRSWALRYYGTRSAQTMTRPRPIEEAIRPVPEA